MSEGTKIPGIGSRLVEMLVGNDKTGQDLAAMFSIPLMTAGVSSAVTHFSDGALGGLSPNLSTVVAPVIAQTQNTGTARTK